MASISLEELKLFHSIDRDIFTRLIIKLSRNISESLLVMSLWLWLGERNFPSITTKLQKLPDSILDMVANEATLCLKVLQSQDQDQSRSSKMISSLDCPLILISRIMQKEILLDFFVQNRFTTISGVKTLLNNVCARIFTDILQAVLQNPNDDPIVVPGFPHLTFGPLSIVTHHLEYDLPSDNVLWGLDSGRMVHQDDRTMFLTFSRGFRVTPDEVIALFTRLYGDCVDSVQMEGVQSEGDQPLFSLMILHSVSTIDKMLKGKQIAKFKVNGKHIWARKYEPRD